MPLPDDPPLNPYAAPQAELQPTDSRQRLAKSSLRLWLIVLLVNLPLPILVGCQLGDRNGRLAMLAMVALLLLMSSWLVAAKPWFGRRLIAGGVVVAISQCFPILHFIIAGAAAYFVEPLSRGFIQNYQYSPAAIMLLTLFVSLGLMLAAFGLGCLPSVADPYEPFEQGHG